MPDHGAGTNAQHAHDVCSTHRQILDPQDRVLGRHPRDVGAQRAVFALGIFAPPAADDVGLTQLEQQRDALGLHTVDEATNRTVGPVGV